MNFKLYYDNNTWEREDCNHKLAEYLMCEHKHKGKTSGKSNEMLICFLTIISNTVAISTS
jgi:hypothetical protein